MSFLAFVECPARFTLAADGRWGIAPVDGEVHLANRETGRVLKFTPALPPDAQQVLRPFVGPDGELWLHAAATKRIERYRLPVGGDGVR